jgi:hypothetical protein
VGFGAGERGSMFAVALQGWCLATEQEGAFASGMCALVTRKCRRIHWGCGEGTSSYSAGRKYSTVSNNPHGIGPSWPAFSRPDWPIHMCFCHHGYLAPCEVPNKRLIVPIQLWVLVELTIVALAQQPQCGQTSFDKEVTGQVIRAVNRASQPHWCSIATALT